MNLRNLWTDTGGRSRFQNVFLPALLLIGTLFLIGTVLWMCSAIQKVRNGGTPTAEPTAEPTVNPSAEPDATDTPVASPTDTPTDTPTPTPDCPEPIVTLRDGKYTYDDMLADMQALTKRYPAFFSYKSVGNSADGRQVVAATLGNPDAGRQIILTSGMHAREYVTPYCVMRQAEAYLASYDTATYEGVTYRELFEDVCLVILPMTNPDGITMAQEGISAIRSEELQTLIRGICAASGSELSLDEYLRTNWKSNARGVDLNRNFDALWNAFSDGAGKPGTKNYKGEAPASEPETRALVALTESLSNPVASVCIHMQGEVLYWRCFQTGELSENNRRLVELTAELTGYAIDGEEQVEPSYSNWTIVKMGIPTITVENGVSAYPLSFDLAEGILTQNAPLWAAYAYEYRP